MFHLDNGHHSTVQSPRFNLGPYAPGQGMEGILLDGSLRPGVSKALDFLGELRRDDEPDGLGVVDVGY